MVHVLPKFTGEAGVCEGSATRKPHREYLPKYRSWRARAALELTHTNLCGPIKNPSLS